MALLKGFPPSNTISPTTCGGMGTAVEDKFVTGCEFVASFYAHSYARISSSMFVYAVGTDFGPRTVSLDLTDHKKILVLAPVFPCADPAPPRKVRLRMTSAPEYNHNAPACEVVEVVADAPAGDKKFIPAEFEAVFLGESKFTICGAYFVHKVKTAHGTDLVSLDPRGHREVVDIFHAVRDQPRLPDQPHPFVIQLKVVDTGDRFRGAPLCIVTGWSNAEKAKAWWPPQQQPSQPPQQQPSQPPQQQPSQPPQFKPEEAILDWVNESYHDDSDCAYHVAKHFDNFIVLVQRAGMRPKYLGWFQAILNKVGGVVADKDFTFAGYHKGHSVYRAKFDAFPE